jgi:hypothetical protein
MDSHVLEHDTCPGGKSPRWQVQRPAPAAPTNPDGPPMTSNEVPPLRAPTPPNRSGGSVSPKPATPKRSYADIAGDSESLSSSKAQKLHSPFPVKSAVVSDAQPQGPKPPMKPSGQGNQLGGGGSMPPRRPSQNMIGFRPTTGWEKRNWAKATFQPGTIISALHYEEYIDYGQGTLTSPSGTPGSPGSSGSGMEPSLCPFRDPRGSLVCRKQRIMIVIHAFDDHYVAVPIFSYGGRGLSEKTDKKAAEHMDVHDHRRTDNISQNSLPTLVTKNMQRWFEPLVPRSAVYFTYPVSLNYRRKVGLVGELTEDSTMQLINYYYDHAGRPHLSTDLQPQQAATPVATVPEVGMYDH